jgi:hypothetical protein
LADQHLAGIERQRASMHRSCVVLPQPDEPAMASDLAPAYIRIDIAERFERAVILARAADADARPGTARPAAGQRAPDIAC